MAAAHPTAHIRVVPDGPKWRISVGDGQSPLVEASCPAITAPLALPTPRVLLAGSDASLAAEEARYSQRLCETLSAAAPAWAHLQMLRGRAEAVGRSLLVAVDGPSHVCWELLSLGRAAVEATGRGVVVRWASGAAPSPRAIRRSAAVWEATDDSASAAVAASARTALEQAGFAIVAPQDGPSLLWVVAHGERGANALEVAMGQRGVGVNAVSAKLSGALSDALVVVLGVCHAASSEAPRTPALVSPLLAAGVPVVVAPTGPVPVQVLEHFSEGMSDALGAGSSVADAIAAGRRAVRAWAFPHPLARWTGLRCYAGRLDALSAVLCPASWVPEDWPSPRPDAAVWLRAAHDDAVRRTDGYVGIDHLLRTLSSVVGGESCAATVRRCAAMWLRPYEESSAGLLPQAGADAQVASTPRLRALGHALRTGFSLEGLAAAVLGQHTLAPLGARRPMDSGLDALRTLENSVPPSAPVADALEVVGGPEDGRLIVLDDDLVIGRAGGNAGVELYHGTRLTDRKLSRRHLIWSDGRLHSSRSVSVQGPEGPREVDAPLRHGDVVTVTAATRLRAVYRG